MHINVSHCKYFFRGAKPFSRGVKYSLKPLKNPVDACVLYIAFIATFSDHFPWFVKFIYWLRPGWYLPPFRKLKTMILDCVNERRQKAMAKQVCVLYAYSWCLRVHMIQESNNYSRLQFLLSPTMIEP